MGTHWQYELRLQDVPLDPDDIDVQTTETGAYTIEECFSEDIIESVCFSEGEQIRSNFGVLELRGVRVELMGAVQKRRQDGTWEPPVDIRNHRKFVTLNGMQIPVLSLRYEAQAYERLGRMERAERLREYAE